MAGEVVVLPPDGAGRRRICFDATFELHRLAFSERVDRLNADVRLEEDVQEEASIALSDGIGDLELGRKIVV